MPLKDFVSDYTDGQGKKKGKENRIEFNLTPKPVLTKYKVKGDSLKAFLSFHPPTISEQVFREVMQKGWTEPNAKDFSKWLNDYAQWSWPEGQEHLYVAPLCAPAAHKPSYGEPICHIEDAKGEVQGTSSQPGKKKVKVKVWGEGFLPGAKVECVNVTTKEVTAAGKATFTANSTFRCSLLTATANLKPGKYRARVQSPLGKKQYYAIDRNAEGKPSKTFTV